jgi:UDP-N-acetylmuramate dehydrogenase
MNAGCYGQETSSVLKEARALDEKGNLHILNKNDIGYIYRGNTLPDGWIFTEGCFTLSPAPTEEILNNIDRISEQRANSQPIKSKTGGSTFKNPTGYKAWELIDKAGLRGYKIGDAIVSEKHCNFLINQGNAKASDLEDLGNLIQEKVKDKFNIDLEWEIQRIGEK